MKIGIFGGSFNPIHYGHLLMAESAYEQIGLDKVIFIPLKYPAHKSASDILEDEHRLKMLELAISDNLHFEISNYELKKDTTSYTFETLTYLSTIYKNDELYFILGGDSYNNLINWKEPQIIINHATLLVVNRDKESNNKLKEITKEYNKFFENLKVEYINMPAIGISSTDIRHKIQQSNSIRYYLPDAVIHYIKKHNIYCN